MKTIKYFYGLKLGGFVDIYELDVTLARKVAFNEIKSHFPKVRALGKNYRDASVLILSSRLDLEVYFRPGVIIFEVHHRGPISMRLFRGRLDSKLKKLALVLREMAASPSTQDA